MNNSQRIEFIDLAKGICIILVILGHLVPAFNENFTFVFCFRIPLYFCLSGLFFKDYGGFKQLFAKKTNKILIPFIAWYFISYLIYYAGHGIYGLKSGDALYSITDILTSNSIFNIPIWFLLCLFWSNLIFYIIKLFSHNIFFIGTGIFIVAFIGWAMSLLNIPNILYIGSACSCMPYFFMGYALKRSSLLYPTKQWQKDFAIMLIALTVGALMAFIPDDPPRHVYFINKIKSGNLFAIYICAASFVIGILLLCKRIGHLPFVSWLGRYSIMVLVTHMLVGTVFLGLQARLFRGVLSLEQVYPLNFVFVVLSMLIIIPFCKKYMPYITAQKDIFGPEGLIAKRFNKNK